jgi:hypothetical protein
MRSREHMMETPIKVQVSLMLLNEHIVSVSDSTIMTPASDSGALPIFWLTKDNGDSLQARIESDTYTGTIDEIVAQIKLALEAAVTVFTKTEAPAKVQGDLFSMSVPSRNSTRPKNLYVRVRQE